MSNSTHMVRPKRRVLPLMQVWYVLREDAETGEVEAFTIECPEGYFLTYYRNLGLAEGNQPFDPYLDMDKGRMTHQLLYTFR